MFLSFFYSSHSFNQTNDDEQQPKATTGSSESVGRGIESRPFPFPLINPVFSGDAMAPVRNIKQSTVTSKYGTSALSNHRLDDKPLKVVYPSYSSSTNNDKTGKRTYTHKK